MTDNTTVSRQYRVCADPANDIWRKYSFWTQAEDVILTDGTDLQTKIDSLKTEEDSHQTDSVQLPITGKAIHDEIQLKIDELKAYYEKEIDKIEVAINESLTGNIDPVDDKEIINGWILIVKLLNDLREEVTERTEDMLYDLEGFTIESSDLEATLSQDSHDALVARLNDLQTAETGDINDLKGMIGDISSMDYMLSDNTNTTDTKIAPLILHHQSAIDALNSLSAVLPWETVDASTAITVSSSVSSVSGTLRYQKDTGLCSATLSFPTVTCAAGAEVTLGTLASKYVPLPLQTTDAQVWNTAFTVQIFDSSKEPEVMGIIDDNGVIKLKNRSHVSTQSFNDSINVGFMYVAKTAS